ncbi:MAG: helix-turn-helix transcriptional regulator [Mariprofundaceae bacterium]
MPSKSPESLNVAADKIAALGKQIRIHRKAMHISATVAAETAGMSRVTWHRIEKGETSVTMGAYLNAMAVLGLDFGIIEAVTVDRPDEDRIGLIPARIALADYPQLKKLAWQLHGTETLSPVEALNIYERNWRHVDTKALGAREQKLIDALRQGFGESHEQI